MKSVTCKQQARQWVHKLALTGGIIAAIPIPGSSSSTLSSLENYLVAEICKIYRHEGTEEIIIALSMEAVVTPILRTFSKKLGWIGLKGIVGRSVTAGSFVELLGNTIITILDRRYPGRLYQSG